MSEDTAGAPPPGKWKARADATRERALARAEWAREHLPWGDVVAEALERERIAAAGLLAGGLAYRLFFWIVPLGLVFSASLGYWVAGFSTPAFLKDLEAGTGTCSDAAGLLATQLVGEPITLNLIGGLIAVFIGIWIATTEAASRAPAS